MQKKKLPPYQDESSSVAGFPYTTILATLLLAILAFLLLEYFYQIPSRFFVTENPNKIDVVAPESGKSLEACTMEYAPVCGKDDVTYSNSCIARRAGATIAHDGSCVAAGDTLVSTGNDTLPSAESNNGEALPVKVTPVVSTGTIMKPPVVVNPPKTVSSEVQLLDSGSYQVYTNASAGYQIALPKYVYYQGYGARDGAAHTLAISLTNTGIDTFAASDVRVYYYKGSAPSDVMAGSTRIETASGTIIIDSSHASNPKVQKIIDTIRMSAN